MAEAIGYRYLPAFVEIDGERVQIGHMKFPIHASLERISPDGKAKVELYLGPVKFEEEFPRSEKFYIEAQRAEKELNGLE